MNPDDASCKLLAMISTRFTRKGVQVLSGIVRAGVTVSTRTVYSGNWWCLILVSVTVATSKQAESYNPVQPHWTGWWKWTGLLCKTIKHMRASGGLHLFFSLLHELSQGCCCYTNVGGCWIRPIDLSQLAIALQSPRLQPHHLPLRNQLTGGVWEWDGTGAVFMPSTSRDRWLLHQPLAV